MYFVYILACRQTARSYVGQTDNLIRRYRMHCAGLTRTTRERLRDPVVVHWEAFPTRAEAMQRERYFKAGAGHRLKQTIVAKGIQAWAQDG